MKRSELSENACEAGVFDVAVIGGGVVGCAMARRFTLEGAKTVLLERSADILSGASKGNSAILHTGFDAPPNSLELKCVQRGYAEYVDIRAQMNLPLLQTGAHVVAWNQTDLDKFDSIIAKAHGNGVNDVCAIEADELHLREPGLSAEAKGAIWVPGESLVDPWSAPLAYLQQAVANGAFVQFNSDIENGRFDGQLWHLDTPRGVIRARTVINCAGLRGDLLEQQLIGDCEFEIRPRKGQFVVFDKAAHHLIESIILPVPNERTKGIVLTRTIFGNLLVGPTAEEQEDREHAQLDHDTLESLKQAAISHIPALANMPVTATYAGLRPASEEKPYRVRDRAEHNWISVGGIRSTGLTGALGIATHIYELYSAQHQHQRLNTPQSVTVPNLAEHAARDWQTPGYEEIVCHCELVTKREIEATFDSLVPPGDFGGLRRRTRACMGRCQSFYCGARVAELTEGKLQTPLAVKENGDD